MGKDSNVFNLFFFYKLGYFRLAIIFPWGTKVHQKFPIAALILYQ